MPFSYVKPLPVGKAEFVLLVGVQVTEDHPGRFDRTHVMWMNVG
jgi:hypothetical protein